MQPACSWAVFCGFSFYRLGFLFYFRLFDENQVELKDVVKTMNKLPKALTQQEVQGVSNRLSTLNHVRNPMNSIPKGINPNRVRPDRRAMRGR